MEIRICPDCSRAFYTPIGKDYIVCPLCRHVLHDRRIQKRVQCSIDFTFTRGDEKKVATLKDYSENGSRIVCRGAVLPDDVVLKVDIDELNLHRSGRLVWIKNVAGVGKVMGLKLS